jgi:hypothetical protein
MALFLAKACAFFGNPVAVFQNLRPDLKFVRPVFAHLVAVGKKMVAGATDLRPVRGKLRAVSEKVRPGFRKLRPVWKKLRSGGRNRVAGLTACDQFGKICAQIF